MSIYACDRLAAGLNATNPFLPPRSRDVNESDVDDRHRHSCGGVWGTTARSP